jgi:CsoR family transcriptional regulator, copper-sensing transcriptional repressor
MITRTGSAAVRSLALPRQGQHDRVEDKKVGGVGLVNHARYMQAQLDLQNGVGCTVIREDKSFADIVQQISAVRAALDAVVEVMVQDLVEHYVSQTRDERGKELAIELKDTVSNILASGYNCCGKS